ncbi:CARDB domain-containing protein [Paenibacillus graminis]|uniref:CARDB domain-containing protein n=1 Tax=Paenibacillus graminis TaxID=189425 RepID=UPI002DC055B8|nr:CARDB domain-containing protein [Paenibacillus graminis]MEC0167358.1 CARDB domain-containing protein [Paenibacillus graminis]
MKNRATFITAIMAVFLLLSSVASAAGESPMLKKYTGWTYGYSDERFSGYIPAIDKFVEKNPWELAQWQGLFTFGDGKTRTVSNYDVFNVKRKPDDEKFDKENGFGLVFKSKQALGDLFDSIWAGQTGLSAAQRDYFRDKFTSSADDPIFKDGNPFYYTVEEWYPFLRTSGIVQRMGIRFNKTQKNGSTYQALYDVSKWPELKVTQGNNLSINFAAYGYTERNIRLVAAPAGKFRNLKNVVNLTDDGKLIPSSAEKEEGIYQFKAANLVKTLGKKVDIILDDGYGRTAIQTLTLPDNKAMDFVPTKLTMTDAGQFWVKFRYDGDDIISSDYIQKNGIPNTLNLKVGGAITTEFNTGSKFTEIPQTLVKGTTFNAYMGKIDVGQKPGKYYIKAEAVVNNPNHQERALESPATAYNNNSIKGEFLIEIKAPETDLVAVSVTASPGSIAKGGQTKITAKVKNDGKLAQDNVLIRIFDNSSKIYEVRKSFGVGQTLTVGPFNWIGHSTGAHNIMAVVDPDKEKLDKNRSNNVATTGCTVGSGAAGGGSTGDCNKPQAEGSLTVSYPLITGYPEKSRESYYTDSDGKRQWYTYTYTDYSDPIWENRNVQYKEKLTISAEINTKQGIATDPNHPKASDSESRGAWEIIPYAKKGGKNPNEITRAGYGIELKVKTTYTTDWETKVPTGLEDTAHPLGGEYHGPDTLYASFYGPNGKLEKQVKLEKTSGDKDTATWELPLQTISSDSGKSYQSRKYMTSVNTPDGYYRIKISTDPAGINGLVTCITKQVEVYGSMYDDIQNLRRPN